jgi:hypothetical protein
LHTASGTDVLLRQVTTTATGAYSTTINATQSGTLIARVVSVTGYVNADSAGVPLTISP